MRKSLTSGKPHRFRNVSKVARTRCHVSTRLRERDDHFSEAEVMESSSRGPEAETIVLIGENPPRLNAHAQGGASCVKVLIDLLIVLNEQPSTPSKR